MIAANVLAVLGLAALQPIAHPTPAQPTETFHLAAFDSATGAPIGLVQTFPTRPIGAVLTLSSDPDAVLGNKGPIFSFVAGPPAVSPDSAHTYGTLHFAETTNAITANVSTAYDLDYTLVTSEPDPDAHAPGAFAVDTAFVALGPYNSNVVATLYIDPIDGDVAGKLVLLTNDGHQQREWIWFESVSPNEEPLRDTAGTIRGARGPGLTSKDLPAGAKFVTLHALPAAATTI